MISHVSGRVFLATLAFAILLGALCGSARAQENDYRKALGIISEKLHRRFPSLRGAVVAVRGGDLYVSLGEKEGAVKGVRLNVYRKGAAFRHPATGAVLGALEDEVAEIEIAEVREQFSIARVVRLAAGGRFDPRVGDEVRISRAKVRLAILPFVNRTKEAISMETLTRELAGRLLSRGRFDVYDVDRLQVWLLETAIATDEILKGENPIRLRNQIRADMAIENEVREVGGKKVLSSRLLSLTTSKELFKAVSIAAELPFEQVPPTEQRLRRADDGRPAPANASFVLARQGTPGAGGGARNYHFEKLAFRAMSVADVDGDAKNEVVVIAADTLIVYRLEGDRMREVARFGGGGTYDFRWLDVADMNGDGTPEFYLANYRAGELFSLVLQMKGGKFTTLHANDRTFYRLVRVRRPEKGEKIPDAEAFALLGQREGFEKPLVGPVMRYRWSGGKLSAAGPYPLPPGLTVLGFGLWDLDGDGAQDVIEVGEDDRLRVYARGGEVVFSSSEIYGAPVHRFVFNPGDDSAGEREFDAPRFALRSRVLVHDVDGDNVREVLVIRNEYATTLAPGLGVSSGQIASLVWDGGGLFESWRTRRINMGVVDFTLADADNDGVDDLVLAATAAASFADAKSRIIFYKLGKP